MAQTQKPAYRGVDRDAVIDSLKKAEAFIRGLDLGPENEKLLDEWLAGSPYEKLAAAKDDRELAQAVRETGSGGIFRRMGDVFRFHAVVNTEGRRVMEDLGRWGAFNGMEYADYRDADAERHSYLVKNYARLIRAEGYRALNRLEDLLNEVREHIPDEYDNYAESGFEIIVLLDEETEEELLAQMELTFNAATRRERHILKHVLSVMAGTVEEEFDLRVNMPSPISRYGVAVDISGLPERWNFGDLQDVVDDALGDKVHKVLEPFYETDDVLNTMIGAITEDGRQAGLMFDATEKVALAVAKALPGFRVIDWQGRAVGVQEKDGMKPAAPAEPALP